MPDFGTTPEAQDKYVIKGSGDLSIPFDTLKTRLKDFFDKYDKMIISKYQGISYFGIMLAILLACSTSDFKDSFLDIPGTAWQGFFLLLWVFCFIKSILAYKEWHQNKNVSITEFVGQIKRDAEKIDGK